MADFLKINQKKCNGCGLCSQVCPSRCLAVVAGCLAMVKGKKCIECGHCEAVCEKQGIEIPSSRGISPYNTFQLEKRWRPYGEGDLGKLAGLMHSRRSCRRYEARDVPLAVLEDLIRIGTSAPSGTNSQEWIFTVLENRRQVEAFGGAAACFYDGLNKKAGNPFLRFLDRFAGKGALCRYYAEYYQGVAESLLAWKDGHEDRLFHGAPAVIAVGSRNSASCPAEDALLASQNILLAAHAMGLGTCLIGYAVEALRRDRRLQELLGLQGDERIYAVIALGFPAVRFGKLIGRKEPKVRFPLR